MLKVIVIWTAVWHGSKTIKDGSASSGGERRERRAECTASKEVQNSRQEEPRSHPHRGLQHANVSSV